MPWSNTPTSLGGTFPSGTVATVALTTTAAAPANSWIFVLVTNFTARTLSSVSGGGLTWTVEGTLSQSAGVHLARAWAPAGLALGTVITATFNGTSSDRGICALAFTGGFADSTAQAAAVFNTGTTAAWSVASTGGASGDLLVGGLGHTGANVTNTPDANTVEDFDGNATTPGGGGTTISLTAGHRIASAAAQGIGGTLSAAPAANATRSIVRGFTPGTAPGPTTFFGALALPITASRAVVATRRTFSGLALPATFAATTSGQRKVFGQVARPSTFGATTQAQRKTFGQVARPATFAAATAAQRKTFGQVARPLTFAAVTAGQRVAVTHFGAVSLAGAFAAATQASRKTFGQVARPATFGAVTQAQRRTFGQVARPAVFGAVTVGQRKTFGQVARPLAFAAVTAGQRKVFGVVARPVVFAAATAGQASTPAASHFGSVSLVAAFGAVSQGRRKTFAVVARPVTLGALTQARRGTFGQVARPSTFGAVTVGRRRTFASTVVPITFAAVVDGRRLVTGSFGRVAASWSFGSTTAGRRRAFGVVARPITALVAVTGQRGTFGQTRLVVVLDRSTAGHVDTFAVVALPLSFGAFTSGKGIRLVLPPLLDVAISGAPRITTSVTTPGRPTVTATLERPAVEVEQPSPPAAASAASSERVRVTPTSR